MAGTREKAIENGKNTRFKKGNTVQKDTGAKPYSYRHQLAWAAAQELDAGDIAGSFKKLKNYTKKKGESTITVARLFAITFVEAAIKQKDSALFDKIIDQTEGKLTQEIILPAQAKAPEKTTSAEDAARVYSEHVAK